MFICFTVLVTCERRFFCCSYTSAHAPCGCSSNRRRRMNERSLCTCPGIYITVTSTRDVCFFFFGYSPKFSSSRFMPRYHHFIVVGRPRRKYLFLGASPRPKVPHNLELLPATTTSELWNGVYTKLHYLWWTRIYYGEDNMQTFSLKGHSRSTTADSRSVAPYRKIDWTRQYKRLHAITSGFPLNFLNRLWLVI